MSLLELAKIVRAKKRRIFLIGLASGLTPKDAYRKAYPKASERTIADNATRLRSNLFATPEVLEWYKAEFSRNSEKEDDEIQQTREKYKNALLTIGQRMAILANIARHGKPLKRIKVLDVYKRKRPHSYNGSRTPYEARMAA